MPRYLTAEDLRHTIATHWPTEEEVDAMFEILKATMGYTLQDAERAIEQDLEWEDIT